MKKEDELKTAIKKEMIRLIRNEKLEFKVQSDIYVVPKEHVRYLVESQSLEVLNLLYPKDCNSNVLENDHLEKCVETSFDGVVNIPNKNNRCAFDGSTEVSYVDDKFVVSLKLPITLKIR